MKGDGGMVIAPPSARADGVYQWLNDLPIADAPQWLLDYVCGDNVTEPERGNGANSFEQHGDRVQFGASIERVVAALAVIPNGEDVDRKQWVDVCHMVKNATNGSEEGFAAFDVWSQKYPKYNAADTRDLWDGAKPNRIGAGTLFHLARVGWPPQLGGGGGSKGRAADPVSRRPDNVGADLAGHVVHDGRQALVVATSRMLLASTGAYYRLANDETIREKAWTSWKEPCGLK